MSYFFIQGKNTLLSPRESGLLNEKIIWLKLAASRSFKKATLAMSCISFFLFFFLPLTISPNAFSDVLVLVEQHGRSEKAETYIAPNKRIKKIVSIFLFLCWLPIPITRDLKHQDGRGRRRLSGSKITAWESTAHVTKIASSRPATYTT